MQKAKLAYWKKVVILLCLGWMSIWIYRTMLTPIYDEIQVTIGTYSGLTMGMISSMYFMGYVFTQIPGGILMDKVGKKVVLIPGFILFALGIIVIGFASNITMMFVGSLMAGIGTGTYYSGAFSLSGENVPAKYKYFATAIINNGCAIGMIVGYLSGGLLVKSAGLPWQSMVFGVAFLVVLVTISFAVGLQNDKPSKKKQNEVLQSVQDATQRNLLPREQQSTSVDYKSFFELRMIGTYFFYFSTCYGYYMIVTWLPSFLETERGVEGSAASVYACIVALVSIPGAMFLGKILDKFSQKRVTMMTWLQCGSAIMIILISNFSIMWALLLCLGLYGLCGKQAIDPLIVPHVSGAISDKAKTTGLGIFNFFGMSGSILAPSITGYAEDIFGSKIYGFYIAVLLLVISSIFFWFTNKKAVANEI
ncbi:MAG: MFS transporter [Eubacteriales bacterium]